MLLPLLCLLFIAIFFAAFFDKKLSETFFLSAASIIIVLYICGLLNFSGSLLLGYAFVILFALLSLLSIMCIYQKDKDIFKRISLMNGFCLLVFFLVASFALHYGRLYYQSDEFINWGLAVKHMYLYDALSTYCGSNLYFQSYLPGLSLFQYFWVRPYGQFVEYPAYIASNIFFYSIVSVFISRINIYNILIVVVLMVAPITMRMNVYNSLYVDSFLGVLFGAAILLYFYYRYEESEFGILMVTAAVGLISIIKDVGLLFCIILLSIIIIDILLFKRSAISKYCFQENTKTLMVKRIILLISPLIVVLLTRLSWGLLLASTNARLLWSGSSNIFALLSQQEIMSHQNEVINNFFPALIDKPLFPYGFTAIHLILLSLILTVVFGLILKNNRISAVRPVVANILVIAGSIIYTCFMFIFYMFYLGEYEAAGIASFNRYILTYYITLFITPAIFLIVLSENKFICFRVILNKIRKHRIIALIFIIVLIAVANLGCHLLPEHIKDWLSNYSDLAKKGLVGYSVGDTYIIREPYTHFLRWSDYLIEHDKRVYITVEGDFDHSRSILNYLVYPQYISNVAGYSTTGLFSVDQNNYEKIMLDKDSWENDIINNYDYLYIFKYDQLFDDYYGCYFDNLTEGKLYTVTADLSGKIHLITMDE